MDTVSDALSSVAMTNQKLRHIATQIIVIKNHSNNMESYTSKAEHR